MIPDKSSFISYRPVSGRRVRMGNNSFAPVLGSGSAVIAINGKRILIRECLHVPTLWNPLYSLCAHQRQHGCGFIGMQGLGMFVFFPSFIIEVDTATDYHLLYAPIGRTATMSSLDYVQPIQARNSASATASTPPPAPVVIEADGDDIPPEALPTYVSHWPKKPPAPPAPPVVLPVIPPPAYSVRLKDLTCEELIQRLYSVKHAHCPVDGDNLPAQPSPLVKLECMSDEEIVATLHRPHSRLRRSGLVTRLMLWRPSEHIHRRNSIDSPAVAAFATINILFPARKTASCSTPTSFPSPSAHMRQSQKHPAARQLIGSWLNILTSSMSILLLETASPSVGTNSPSSLSTVPPATTGCLALNLSNTMAFNPHFLPFKMRPALSPVSSNVTAMRICLAALYLLPPQPQLFHRGQPGRLSVFERAG
jgi:hypothetical protein